MTRAAFYLVSDERYFLGTVAAIDSLRVHGHAEPVYVLDLGLTREQRRLLGAEATLVSGAPGPPYLQKAEAPLAHPAEVQVLLDADAVLTQSLGELIDVAARGRVVAFEDRASRFFPKWGELLGLGPVSPGPYVCSACVLFGGTPGAEALAELRSGQERVEFALTHYGEADSAYPFRFPEQDVLNGVLRADANAGLLHALPERLAPAPPFGGLRVIEPAAMRCAYADGTEPYLVHHHGPKPWLEPLDDGVYSRLLRRLLTADDAAVPVPASMLPHRLRTGPGAYLRRKAVNARWWLRWHAGRDPITTPLGGE